jgi:hypothetical protein
MGCLPSTPLDASACMRALNASGAAKCGNSPRNATRSERKS